MSKPPKLGRMSTTALAEETRSVYAERAADRNEASGEDCDHQDHDGPSVGREIGRREPKQYRLHGARNRPCEC